MAVGVERRLGERVAHPRLHGFDVGAGRDEHRGEVVPQVVEAESFGWVVNLVPEFVFRIERDRARRELASGSGPADGC